MEDRLVGCRVKVFFFLPAKDDEKITEMFLYEKFFFLPGFGRLEKGLGVFFPSCLFFSPLQEKFSELAFFFVFMFRDSHFQSHLISSLFIILLSNNPQQFSSTSSKNIYAFFLLLSYRVCFLSYSILFYQLFCLVCYYY